MSLLNYLVRGIPATCSVYPDMCLRAIPATYSVYSDMCLRGYFSYLPWLARYVFEGVFQLLAVSIQTYV
ncbi:hypothetical protein DPMN_034471 [Dreissena polymorpha]|uniref:Uncharacterized protein n=1 Tax=Dreissena polymorpha TaxID=45954 RepID=A0A9D4RJT4_DREPO|nr:hypothetical protein DPMN_034471 [Dreissena polymorpha]